MILMANFELKRILAAARFSGSKCGPTWDFICYIENICIAHLLKAIMVAALVYFVLLFSYLLFNLGICQCICRTLFRIISSCFSTYFSALNCCCTYLCYKLGSVKRKRRRDVEEFDAPSMSSTSVDDYELGKISSVQQSRTHKHGRYSKFSQRRSYKNEHLRRCLRPSNHRAHVELWELYSSS